MTELTPTVAEVQPPSPCYIWEAPGKISIQVHLGVVLGLELASQEAATSEGPGREVGGLLLGRAASDRSLEVVIEDYEAVPCGRRRLEEALTRWRRDSSAGRRVVGFYRRHASDLLFLDDEDLSLMRTYFTDPSSVCLLLRPSETGTPVGGFFFWDGGQIRRESVYAEFPVGVAQLVGGSYRIVETTAAAPLLPAPVETEPARPRRWKWLSVAAVLLLGTAIAGFRALRAPPAEVAPEVAAAPLRLEVAAEGSRLRLSWDPAPEAHERLPPERPVDTARAPLAARPLPTPSVFVAWRPEKSSTPAPATLKPQGADDSAGRSHTVPSGAPGGQAELRPQVAAAAPPAAVDAPAPVPTPPIEPVARPAPATSSPVPTAPPAPPPVEIATNPIPTSGRIVWTGQLRANAVLSIEGRRPSSGVVSGQLPGAPVAVAVYPAEFSSRGLVVYTAHPKHARLGGSFTEPAGPQNGWNQTQYVWDPRRAREVVVVEAPSSGNGWQGLVLRSQSRSVSVCIIEWELRD